MNEILRSKKSLLKEISWTLSEILSVSQKLLTLKTHQMDSLRHDDGAPRKDGDEEDSCDCCHLHGTPECRHHDDEPRSAEPSPAEAGTHECCYADDGRCHVCGNPEFADCEACAPCECDDECGCVPGPCAMCGHQRDPRISADTSASQAKREAASSDYVPIAPDPNKPHWCERCRIWSGRKHLHTPIPSREIS